MFRACRPIRNFNRKNCLLCAVGDHFGLHALHFRVQTGSSKTGSRSFWSWCVILGAPRWFGCLLEPRWSRSVVLQEPSLGHRELFCVVLGLVRSHSRVILRPCLHKLSLVIYFGSRVCLNWSLLSILVVMQGVTPLFSGHAFNARGGVFQGRGRGGVNPSP